MIMSPHSNDHNLPHIVAADIYYHQWTCIITYLEGCVQNQPFFVVAPLLGLSL